MTAKEELNELAKKWKSLSKEKDSAAYQALWQKIWIKAYEIYCSPSRLKYLQRKDGSDVWLDAHLDAFVQTMKEVYEKFEFKNETTTLSQFISVRVDQRNQKKYLSKAKKKYKEKYKEVSFEESLDGEGDDSDSLTRKDTIGVDEKKYEECDYEDIIDSVWYELASLIIHFSERHNKKTGNEIRRQYYKLFYTCSIMGFVKESENVPVLKHERDVISATKVQFLDFCLLDKCRKIIEIYNSGMKLYGDVIVDVAEEKKENPIAIPIETFVAKSYLKQVEGIEITDAAYSLQNKNFTDEIAILLKERDLLIRPPKRKKGKK